MTRKVAFITGASRGIGADAAREFADLIRQDFELYIRDIQSYFLCLEAERARAFEEAREVSEEYECFLMTNGLLDFSC